MTVYKVTGQTAFRGVRPGGELEADLTPDEERRAKARGQIKVVNRSSNEEPKQEEEAPADE